MVTGANRVTKEYIESLGWISDKTSVNRIHYKDNFMLFYDYEECLLTITVSDPCLDPKTEIGLRTKEVFNITIKTKKELKTLLRQFGW